MLIDFTFDIEKRGKRIIIKFYYNENKRVKILNKVGYDYDQNIRNYSFISQIFFLY